MVLEMDIGNGIFEIDLIFLIAKSLMLKSKALIFFNKAG
jgi:hypothetical protein